MKTKLIIYVLTLLNSLPVSAQPSLAAENIIDDVIVTSASGEKASYSLVRDAINKHQWYYIINKARLAEIKSGISSASEPEFTLIKYQYNDLANPGKLKEGGMFQFAILMSPDDTELEKLKASLIQETNDPEARLTALPLKEAHVRLVTPAGDFIEGKETPGIAPLGANQKMAFSIATTKIGTEVYEALVNSNTGMGVAIDFSYNGLTPAAGFNITVNWDESYKFFSENKIVRAKVSAMWNWFSGSAEYKKEKQEILQQLKKSGSISVEATGNEVLTDAMLFAYIDPILKKMTDELLSTSEFNKRLDSMLIAESIGKDTIEQRRKDGKLLNFLSFSLSKSVATKDIRLVKKGKESISFNIKHQVERKSVAGGFVGLGKYTQSIREKHVITVGTIDEWQRAYFILPPIADDADIGIERVALDIRLINKENYTQAFNWTKAKGWTDKDGTLTTLSAFSLMKLKKNNPEFKNASFEITATINAGRDVLKVVQTVEAASAENNLALPLSLVDVIKIDPDLLSFHGIDPASKLAYVTVNITNGDKPVNGILKPRSVNGSPGSPKAFYYLVPKTAVSSKPVSVNIFFTLTDNKIVSWKNNAKSLGELGMSNEIVLQDADYLQTEQ